MKTPKFDFSDVLRPEDQLHPAPEPPKPKRKKPKFDFGIEMDAHIDREVKEIVYDPNKYKVECGDLSLYCAAMFGGPLY